MTNWRNYRLHVAGRAEVTSEIGVRTSMAPHKGLANVCVCDMRIGIWFDTLNQKDGYSHKCGRLSCAVCAHPKRSNTLDI